MADQSRDALFGGADPLEAELEAFTPAPMSKGVVERIGRLREEEPAHAHRLTPGRRLILVGLAVAACVVAVIGLWGDRHADTPVPGPIVATQRSDPAVIVAAGPLPPPSLAAYKRALANSPDALDSLLDAHGPRVLGAPGGVPQTADSLKSSRTQLSTLNGDTL